MRTLELSLWLLCAGWAAWWVIRRPARLTQAILATAAIAVVSLHVVVEDMRFHMGPTYVLLASLIALAA